MHLRRPEYKTSIPDLLSTLQTYHVWERSYLQSVLISTDLSSETNWTADPAQFS